MKIKKAMSAKKRHQTHKQWLWICLCNHLWPQIFVATHGHFICFLPFDFDFPTLGNLVCAKSPPSKGIGGKLLIEKTVPPVPYMPGPYGSGRDFPKICLGIPVTNSTRGICRKMFGVMKYTGKEWPIITRLSKPPVFRENVSKELWSNQRIRNQHPIGQWKKHLGCLG